VSGLSEANVRALLKKYSINPSKKAGQSFLTSHQIVREILNHSKVTGDDEVLEVGGGLGILSRQLAREAKHLTVIEIDPRLVQALKEILKEYDNVTIVHGDALKVQLPTANKIVSNLPYSIASEITFRVLQEMKFESATMMYQKEFARRLVAEPCASDYSRLSLDISYLAEIKKLFDVEAKYFYPIPAVDSTVVNIRHRTVGSFAKDSEVFFWVVRGLYSYPNKLLRKALRIWFKLIGCEKECVDDLLEKIEGVVSGDERLRCLDLESLIEIADNVMLMIDEGKVPDPRNKS